MPRVSRIVLPGNPHHVTHRGNRREPVFFDPDDRVAYCDVLNRYADRHGLAVVAYCLMTNHIHLLVVPENPDSMARVMGKTQETYAKRINRQHGWSGHLWENRFYSAPFEPNRIHIVARYIELNPVRAGIAHQPHDYPWSSARAHCGQTPDPFVKLKKSPSIEQTGDWTRWLETGDLDDDAYAQIRRGTLTGIPIGSEAYLARLEKALKRRIRRRSYSRETKR